MESRLGSADYNPGNNLCRAVVQAVAEAEEVEPSSLDPQLAAAIDPDALNELFAGRTGATGRVVFQYCGYTVTVDRDGSIELSGQEE